MGKDKFYYSDLFKKIANEQKVLLNNGMMTYRMTYVQSLIMIHLLSLKSRREEGDEISQKDVESFLCLRASTVTAILVRMEESGFIVRQRSARDSRANRIEMTELGESLVPLFFDVLEGVESRMTKGMSVEEKDLLRDLLQRVSANLEEEKIE